jgi:hypothetical protein
MADIRDISYTDDVVFTSGGDFLVEFSEDQHVEHIFKAEKGQFYQSPEIGLGVQKLQNGSTSRAEVKQQVVENLELDDFRILSLNVGFDTDGELVIDVDAEKRK